MTKEPLIVQGLPASRSYLPQLDLRPLAVLLIRLSDMAGDPARLVFDQIAQYYCEPSASFVTLLFDFRSGVGIKTYAQKVKEAVTELSKLSEVTFNNSDS
jgi:hypothetical protein